MAPDNTPVLLKDYFQEHGKTMHFSRGENILRDSDTPRGPYMISQGYVKVYTADVRGDTYLHIVYGPGEIFPLAWITDRQEVRVNYAAFTDCTVVRLEESALDEALQNDTALTRALMDAAILQFRLYTTRIENLQYKFARERLIYCLLFLAGRFGDRRDDGSYRLEAPLTQQLIGDFINLSRESVSREFDRLRQMELIDYEGTALVIRDWQKMGEEFKEPIHPEWWGLR
jgi:CRP/FNR family transcriptional regulator, polysaccharide utilization system transcription regulator